LRHDHVLFPEHAFTRQFPSREAAAVAMSSRKACMHDTQACLCRLCPFQHTTCLARSMQRGGEQSSTAQTRHVPLAPAPCL
jgi:hypothetical protein